MNCDDFLDAQTSSDEGRRTAAQWHANACPDCAALADVHARLQKELGAPEPLPQRMRAVWEAVADESPQPTLTRRASEGRRWSRQFPMQLVSMAAALLLFLTVAFLVAHRPKNNGVVIKPGNGNPPVTDVALVKTIDASADLEKLLAQVNSLEAELTKASKQADLVDVRREADVLLATYDNW